jgi:hypothetical protein
VDAGAIGKHVGDVPGETGHQLDASRQAGAQQPQRFLDDLAQRNDASLVGLTAAEGEDLLDEVAGPRARLLHFRQTRLCWMLRHEILPRQCHVTDDGAQDVVEIVRHAAGKRPEGLHLLRLQEGGFQSPARFLRVLAVLDVHQQADVAEELAAGAEARRGRVHHVAIGAIAAAHTALVVPGHLLRRRLAEQPLAGGRVVGME